jgi:hypothetical protein
MAYSKKLKTKRPAGSRHKGLSAAQVTRELEELNRIGIALSETRDVDRLLDLILQKAREITAADAGSLYLAEQVCPSNDSGNNAPTRTDETRRLAFRLTQNDSVKFP